MSNVINECYSVVGSVHVVFGTVIGGAALVRQLEALAVDRNARPLQDVTVTNCGQLVRVSGQYLRTILLIINTKVSL